ncbi:MAG: SURF1 family protein [Rhodanobacteraceae bacterium]|nr:MAG: SURF1 family protein [Rhodanobacteraceae bacterium]
MNLTPFRIRRPSVFAVLLTVFGVAVFCALGVWQLRRATYKETVLARFHHAAGAPFMSLASAVADRRPNAYPHVKVTGKLEGQRVYLLDDQMRSGRLGVMVFVPFLPEAGTRTLLVNLGFLAKMGPDSTTLPDIPPIPGQAVTLTGIYAPPPLPGLKLGGNPLVREKTWPKLVTFIDLGEIARDLHVSVYPHVLLTDPDLHSAYIRSWTANVMPPARHRAYALQWFSFAIAAIVMFFVLHRVKRDDTSDSIQE